jgi:hypothetical protein
MQDLGVGRGPGEPAALLVQLGERTPEQLEQPYSIEEQRLEGAPERDRWLAVHASYVGVINAAWLPLAGVLQGPYLAHIGWSRVAT